MMRWYHFFITNRASILSFLTVGAIAAVINFTLFGFFLTYVHLDYDVAVSIAFVLSVIFHFNANRHFTFKSPRGFYHQLPKYFSMVAINYTITLIVMHVVVEIVHLSPYIGNMVAIGVTVGTGYLMSRYWVFVQVPG